MPSAILGMRQLDLAAILMAGWYPGSGMIDSPNKQREISLMPIERFMVPDELEPVSHYCHVVRAGDFIYLSGMVGMKADGTIPSDTGPR